MKQTKIDTKPLEEFFLSSPVEDIAVIFDRLMWDLVLYELNGESKSASFADDIHDMRCFLEAIRRCKTITDQ